MIAFMLRNNNVVKNFNDLYVVSERFQDGMDLDYAPILVFDDKEDAEFYVKNSTKALTIESCKGIINHKSPIEKISYIDIVFNTDTEEFEKLEITHTNNYDVKESTDINHIHVFGKHVYIKKSCPNDLNSFDEEIAREIVYRIIDDMACRIDGDYKISCFEPKQEITEALLAEFEEYFN